GRGRDRGRVQGRSEGAEPGAAREGTPRGQRRGPDDRGPRGGPAERLRQRGYRPPAPGACPPPDSDPSPGGEYARRVNLRDLAARLGCTLRGDGAVEVS